MKKFLGLFALCVVGALCIVGCASAKKNNVSVKAKNSVIVDWADRNLGVPEAPQWLAKLVQGDSNVFKTNFGIEKSYVIKYGIARAKTIDAAKAASRVYYNAMRAEELRTGILSEAASILNDEGLTDTTADAAMSAKVDLSGHELVTQFWQEIETLDSETELKTKKIICYSVYKISKEAWLETLKAYMKAVLPKIPNSDAQKKMAASISRLYEDTTTEKPNAKIGEEINAKIDAIETGTPNSASPAPNPKDLEWLKVLETACDIIF